MRRTAGGDLWLAASVIGLGLLLLFVWIPLDTETGLVERVRGRSNIGDALAPSAASVLLIVSGLLLALKCLSVGGRGTLGWSNFKYLALIIVIIGISLALMRWTGPMVVALFDGETPYRALRNTWPYKYLGFVAGGCFLVGSLIGLAEGRLRANRWIIAFVVTCAMAMFYDLPFEDLLLPPNGDV